MPLDEKSIFSGQETIFWSKYKKQWQTMEILLHMGIMKIIERL